MNLWKCNFFRIRSSWNSERVESTSERLKAPQNSKEVILVPFSLRSKYTSRSYDIIFHRLSHQSSFHYVILNFYLMTPFLICLGFFLGGVLGYVLGGFKESEELIDSELSDPTVNFAPIWFWRPHMQILEVLYKHEPYEVSRKAINLSLGKSSHHAYERQLWLWGMVDRRRVKNPWLWSTHYYTLTSKGKSALIKFNNKF